MITSYQKLLDHFNGSRSQVAKHFGSSRETIRAWARNGIPPRHALEVERVTYGKVKALDVLRDYEKVGAEGTV